MKNPKKYLIFLAPGSILLFLCIGLRIPPKKISASDLPAIYAISAIHGETIQLSTNEVAYWNSLEFEIVTHSFPGATPDFLVKLIGQKRYSAIYNSGANVIWFSFVSEIRYGWLNSPPPGGWTPPLYQTQATDSLKKLLRIHETYRNRTEH